RKVKVVRGTNLVREVTSCGSADAREALSPRVLRYGAASGSASSNMAQRSIPETTFTADGESPQLDDSEVDAIRRDVAAWRRDSLARAYVDAPPRQARFSTWSGVEVPDLVTPADVAVDYQKDLGLPGEYPFTRGVQPTMYRGRLWTMRMFAGFGTPEQ